MPGQLPSPGTVRSHVPSTNENVVPLYCESSGPENVPLMKRNPLYIPFERVPLNTPELQLRVPPTSALIAKKVAAVPLKLPDAVSMNDSPLPMFCVS